MDNVRALTFLATSQPYYFIKSNTFSNLLTKTSTMAILSGREGVVFKDTAQFYFTVGDVLVNGLPVEFVNIPDTAVLDNQSKLNKYIITEPFLLNENSVFYYSVQYGITDSSSAIQALGNNTYINFKVELIDALTDEIIGTFDNVTYNIDSVFNYDNIAYQVNTTGLGNREVRLRLRAETNYDFDYSLTQRFAEETVLEKSSIKLVNLDAGSPVKEYSLEQNYPNPFNPATAIRYQLPEGGRVTLKIYDVLGREVKTLVDDFKESGRYEVTFDAAELASGVYIYQLRAGDYINSMKMMLVK